MKKVLVTGGCGFLGSNVAADFIKDGIEVTIIDNLSRKGALANKAWIDSISAGGQTRFHHFDMADAECVGRVVLEEGPFDYICHFAGQVAMTVSLENPLADFFTNATGALNLLEAVRRHSPDSIVAFSSTNKVYGDLGWLRYEETESRYITPDYPNGFDESLPLSFSSPYGCSKGCADQYMLDWYRCFGVRTVVFRHSSIYGGRQFSTVDQGWIGWFCQQVLAQKAKERHCRDPESFTIAGSGKQVRDVLHSIDLVALYRSAYEQIGTIAGQVFNIGGGIANSLSILELIALLGNMEDVGPVFRKIERRQSDQDVFVADISKVQSLIGWAPKVAVRDGLLGMLDWCRQIG